MATQLPKLEVIDLSNPPSFTTPTKCINETPDVSRFLTSLAYRDIGLFLMQLNRSVCPRKKPDSAVPIMFRSSTKLNLSPSTKMLQSFLSTFDELIAEAPPAPGTQRFGNVSFRTWHQLMEEKLETLLDQSPLGEILKIGNGAAKSEVKSYLLGAFGSAQRLDYGTGHELSLVAFLGCLWKLGYFKSDSTDGEIEREIVLGVIDPYLALVRKLIMTYRLEPAGTHGVWGLDDHSFVPYIFGSAQLTRPISEDEPMPLEGSVRGAPKPTSITNATTVDDERQTNMYFAAIGFINDIKKGPFWEHSPTLFDISGVKDGWGKINKGMIKMFNAEVLSKFPVVQHFYFGALFSWEQDPNAATATETATSARPHVTSMPPPVTATTGAPWAQSARMPVPAPGAGTAAPWAQASRMQPGAAPPSTTSQRPTGNPISRPDDNTPTRAPWAK